MDILDLVHKDDLPRAMVAIAEVIDHPGTSLSIRCRLRDAAGKLRVMDANFQNVLETPGDGRSPYWTRS